MGSMGGTVVPVATAAQMGGVGALVGMADQMRMGRAEMEAQVVMV